MKHKYTNTQQEMDDDNFFRKAQVPYERSREQAWESLQSRMTDKPPVRLVRHPGYRAVAAAAAVVILLASAFLIMRFYAVSEKTIAGEQLSLVLPDGTRVQLNAGSSLSYHPFWWKVKRKVRFEGEGFFDVEKGDVFSVVSSRGTTSVLGTSFSIYSRPGEYRVTCYTGAVKVSSMVGREVVLSPEYNAQIQMDGSIMVSKENNPDAARSWVNGMFSFVARPLRVVFDEIERQYDVIIYYEAVEEKHYTGYFSREKTVEEVLELVCKPFGITFARRSDTAFQVYPK